MLLTISNERHTSNLPAFGLTIDIVTPQNRFHAPLDVALDEPVK